VGVRFGFTGTGYIAKFHAQAAAKIPDAKLVAVVNHKPESRAEFAQQFKIPRQYDTVKELLDEGEIDALVVCTPNYLHAPETIAALNASVHVMVEKPMAMNVVEAAGMLEASHKSRALLMVGHCWRFDEEVLWLKSQVDSGRLGKIIRTKGFGVHVNWGPGGWFTESKFAGGGAMADMGIHALDTARFLLGDPLPISVYAHFGTYYKPFDVDDTGMVIIHWDNGAISYVESGWWQPHADGPEAATKLYGLEGFGQLFPTFLSLPTQGKIESGYAAVRDPHCPQSMYDVQLAYFVDCICNHHTPKPGGAEGLINVKVVDAAYESARTGQVTQIR